MTCFTTLLFAKHVFALEAVWTSRLLLLYTFTMNRYDTRARLVFHFAREEAQALGHTVVDPEHLLLAPNRSFRSPTE